MHLPIEKRIEASADRSSDGGGDFGERRGHAQPAWGIDAEFVVAAAQVLHKCVNHLSPGARRQNRATSASSGGKRCTHRKTVT
nr:hypothetical protein [Dactylosporangium matsuzakiense]